MSIARAATEVDVANLTVGRSDGRRPRLAGRLSRVAEKLTGSIGKIARNISGDRQRKTMRLTTGEAEGCRFARVRSLSLVVNRMHPGWLVGEDGSATWSDEPCFIRRRNCCNDCSRSGSSETTVKGILVAKSTMVIFTIKNRMRSMGSEGEVRYYCEEDAKS
ncbi:hypothetical protein GW17_00003806 [Ensete ventricosum]|nr:hypothetical protein GW17_00003806 [Ensete ventricosum]